MNKKVVKSGFFVALTAFLAGVIIAIYFMTSSFESAVSSGEPDDSLIRENVEASMDLTTTITTPIFFLGLLIIIIGLLMKTKDDLNATQQSNSNGGAGQAGSADQCVGVTKGVYRDRV